MAMLEYQCRKDKKVVIIKFTESRQWSRWETWDACTVTCGDGAQLRHRYCDIRRNCSRLNNKQRQENCFGDLHCDGQNNVSKPCYRGKCPGKYIKYMWLEIYHSLILTRSPL